MRTLLLIIDPQVDFISGSLPVPGAKEAMDKLAEWIKNDPREFTDIIVTLDSHLPNHISFNSNWQWISKDSRPQTVTYDQLVSGWNSWDVGFTPAPHIHDKFNKIKNYLSTVKELHLWPDHCVVGTEGHQIYKPLVEALDARYRLTGYSWEIVLKGNNPDIEQYSAVASAAPGYNGGLNYSQEINEELLEKFDKIYIAGIARDFCVAETVKDLVKYYPELIKNKLNLVLESMPYISEEMPEIFNEITKEDSVFKATYFTIPKIPNDVYTNLGEAILGRHNVEPNLPEPIENYITLSIEDAEKLFSDLPEFKTNSIKYEDHRNGSVYFIPKAWVEQYYSKENSENKEN